MAVTTREYSLTQSKAKDILQSLHDSINDLGWFEPIPFGYLTAFTNTAGSTIVGEANRRYLVTGSSTTAPAGTGAVFDVLRSPTGAISTVTLVTGGSGYYVVGYNSASSSGTTVTLPSTVGINVGMLVTKLAGGTGTLQTNTMVTSILSSTQITIDQVPSVALSGATLTFSDIITINSGSIGGSSYSYPCTATGGSTTVTVTTLSNVDNIFPGQIVSGSNIGSLTTVSSISGNSLTISKATLGAVNSNLTFSDSILVTATNVVNIQNVTGSASGLTITNVATNSNLFAGAEITIQSGPTWSSSNGRVIIGSISGTGPYTLTLRNDENTFKGFTSAGTITFAAAGGNPSGTGIKWFDIDNFTAPQTYGWAVAKIKNSNDKLGSTFWLFYVGYGTVSYNSVILYAKPLSGFNAVSNLAHGVSRLDWNVQAATDITAANLNIFLASSAYVPLTLRVRQSGIDSNFATFSFFEGNNNRNPFFIPKYNSTTQPWSLSDVFLGGITEIFQLAAFNTSDAGILFRTRMNIPKRIAEAGYGNYNLSTAATYANTYFRTTTGNRMLGAPVAAYDDVALYSRQTGDVQTSLVTTYPIYKTIPVNPHFLPVPYYLPDDFVLIELPWQNPAIRDTVTVSGSEVYTILQTATNQTTFTSIALAARTT